MCCRSTRHIMRSLRGCNKSRRRGRCQCLVITLMRARDGTFGGWRGSMCWVRMCRVESGCQRRGSGRSIATWITWCNKSSTCQRCTEPARRYFLVQRLKAKTKWYRTFLRGNSLRLSWKRTWAWNTPFYIRVMAMIARMAPNLSLRSIQSSPSVSTTTTLD